MLDNSGVLVGVGVIPFETGGAPDTVGCEKKGAVAVAPGGGPGSAEPLSNVLCCGADHGVVGGGVGVISGFNRLARPTLFIG